MRSTDPVLAELQAIRHLLEFATGVTSTQAKAALDARWRKVQSTQEQVGVLEAALGVGPGDVETR